MGRKRSGPVDVVTGTRLRSLRMQKGMSQTVLARRVGVTFQQIQKYEKGANRLSTARLEALAAALGQPVTVFFPSMDRANGINSKAFEQTRNEQRLLEIFGRIDVAAQTTVIRLVEMVASLAIPVTQ